MRSLIRSPSFKQDVLEISRHARPDLHTLDGLHASDKYAGPFNVLRSAATVPTAVVVGLCCG